MSKRFFLVVTIVEDAFYTTDTAEVMDHLDRFPQASVDTLWCHDELTQVYQHVYCIDFMSACDTPCRVYTTEIATMIQYCTDYAGPDLSVTIITVR